MSRIKVFARVRPSKRPSGYFTFQEEHNQLKFDVPLSASAGLVNNSKSEYIFKFDGLLDMDVSQDKVFQTVAKDAVLSAIDGFNSTLFAYGQTGSGKTFTITGGAERYNDRGIIPRSLSFMFNEFKKRTDTQFTAYISYLELYNEQGYDLLDPSHETKSLEELPRVTIMEDDDGNTHLRGLSMHPASTEEEALNLLFLGDTNRAISETPMNDASSRSHCVFTISIEARTAGSSSIRRSKFHLVDLAGSERVHKTNSSGQTLREAKHINTSLHFLEMVIINLSSKKRGNKFVPYRNCRITQVLRDSLGGNCKTAMIATINPEAAQTEESISTCRFAQRVAQVKNSAIVNEETDPYLLIKRLKAEVSSLKAEIAFLKGEQEDGDDLSDEAKQDLMQMCREWVNTGSGKAEEGPQLMIGDFNLNRIHGAFYALKTIAREGGGGGGGGEGTDFTPIAEAKSDVDGAEVKRMRAQLHQRDQEIAILVKMVQKEKAKNAAGGGGGPGGPPGGAYGGSGGMAAPPLHQASSPPRSGYGLPPKAASPIQVHGHDSGAGLSSASGFGSTSGSSVGDSRASASTPAGSVVGVGSGGGRVGGGVGGMLASFSVPTEVLLDRKAALDAFKRNYPKQQIVEENLGVMKQKITEVKQLASVVNGSRKRIQYLKATIEQVRVEKAVHGIVDEAESKEPSPEETKLLADIDAEKRGYRQGYQDLQRLRKEIEHIDKLVTKCRKQLSADFESWYSASLDRAGLTHTSVAAISGVMASAHARGGGGTGAGAGAGAGSTGRSGRTGGDGGGGATGGQAPAPRRIPTASSAPDRHLAGSVGSGGGDNGAAARGGQAWGGDTRASSGSRGGSLYDRAMQMRQAGQQQQQPHGSTGAPNGGGYPAQGQHMPRRGNSAGHAHVVAGGGSMVASGTLPEGFRRGAPDAGARYPAHPAHPAAYPASGQQQYPQQFARTMPAGGYGGAPSHGHPQQQGPAPPRHATGAPPVYPSSPSTGIRSSGAARATSNTMQTGDRSTDEDIMAFYKAKAQLEALRRSGGYK